MIKHELFEDPEPTYNFEVEGFYNILVSFRKM